ncbi:FmdB family zinc ribbon protein [Brachybacterium paraconglomeratum]|uniref:FmdB family zinc ribbon protein n=1 Tax=Brachybacterium paraconglomeratum TaxID=173362 RepID=UPI00223AECBB|nr:FmdB family zinc ribbon protein [Brachybacterium paraconglomeratum]MCT1438025.1 FmdB family transcriptional regulator [Brachybacterium paraconglomeratum]
MPTYVYACKNCGHRFEQYQSFSEDSLTICPECAQEALRKVFDSVGIVFKGSGFYSTDSATSGASTVGGGSSSDGAGSSASSSEGSAGSSSAGSSSGGSSAGSASQPAAAAS